MSKVLNDVIEIYHTYDRPKVSDDRVYLIPPLKYRNTSEMYRLLNFIFFSAEELDVSANIEEDLMCEILKDAYGFMDIGDNAVMNAMSYDMYIVREAGCGRVDVTKVYMIKEFANDKLYEILNREFGRK